MRKVTFFDDEAACDDSESDESGEDGSEGSLNDFVVPDNEPVFADKSPVVVAKPKRGRPRKNTKPTSKKSKKARIDSEDNNSGDDDDYSPTTANKSTVPAAAKRPRGRPRKNIDADSLDDSSSSIAVPKQSNSRTSRQNAVALKGPGHPSFPINDFSLTITKSNGDVGLDAFESVAVFIKDHCIKGGVATEVGKRKFQYHLQGIMRMHWPVTLPYQSLLQKFIRDLLPLKGNGYKVTCKPFQKGQHFSAMTGYITKDEGLPHYDIRTHNISRQELSFGRRDHLALLTSYDDSKKILNLKNMFNECYKFNMRCLYPIVAPIHYVVLYMVQSGTYNLSSDFISVHRKTDLTEARILWDMVHYPRNITISDVLNLIFNPLSYGTKESKRYYMAESYHTSASSAGSASSASSASSAGSAEINTGVILSESSSSSDPLQSTPLALVNSLINIARSGTSYAPSETTLLPDYVPLPVGDDDTTYTIDRNASVGSSVDDISPVDNMQCPEQLEDMLVIVRALREKQFAAHHTLASIMTQAQAEEAKPKERANNLKYTNMSDLEELELQS